MVEWLFCFCCGFAVLVSFRFGVCLRGFGGCWWDFVILVGLGGCEFLVSGLLYFAILSWFCFLFCRWVLFVYFMFRWVCCGWFYVVVVYLVVGLVIASDCDLVGLRRGLF